MKLWTYHRARLNDRGWVQRLLNRAYVLLPGNFGGLMARIVTGRFAGNGAVTCGLTLGGNVTVRFGATFGRKFLAAPDESKAIVS